MKGLRRAVSRVIGLFDDLRSAHVYAGMLVSATGISLALDWWAGLIFAGLVLIWIGARKWA